MEEGRNSLGLSSPFLCTPDGNWEIQHGSRGTDEDVWGDEETLLCHTGNPWVIISISLLYSPGDGLLSFPVVSGWPSSIICHVISLSTLEKYIYLRVRSPQGYFFFTTASFEANTRTWCIFHSELQGWHPLAANTNDSGSEKMLHLSASDNPRFNAQFPQFCVVKKCERQVHPDP